VRRNIFSIGIPRLFLRGDRKGKSILAPVRVSGQEITLRCVMQMRGVSGGPDTRISGSRDAALLVCAPQDPGGVQKKGTLSSFAVFLGGRR
jgi:hypothetical protein